MSLSCSFRFVVLTTVVISVAAFSQADERKTPLPWLSAIGATGRLPAIHTVSTEADVTVSDGLTYTATSVYHDPQRAVFRRVYRDRTVTQGVEGRYVWAFDGRTETEAPPFVEELVLGHQFHAQILFFDRLHPNSGPPAAARFGGTASLVVTDRADTPRRLFYFMPGGLPLGMELIRDGQPPVLVRFDDWRAVDGIRLPYLLRIDDGERQFTYRYRRIALNDGSMAPFRADERLLTDEQMLMRLHRKTMDHHFFGTVDGAESFRADSVSMVSDGDIFRSSGAEADARFERMLKTRDYTVYDDLVRPVIRVSADGTLGWIIAQVSARGVRFDADGRITGPLEFVSAWIGLYEKKEGRWRMTGNVSNFRPGRK